MQVASQSISVRVTNSSTSYMAHMSACGQCGLDLYAKVDDEYIFLATTKINKAEFEITMVKNLDKKLREFRLYLPIYVSLLKLEIGFDSEAQVIIAPFISSILRAPFLVMLLGLPIIATTLSLNGLSLAFLLVFLNLFLGK